jgi:hypothetical protein
MLQRHASVRGRDRGYCQHRIPGRERHGALDPSAVFACHHVSATTATAESPSLVGIRAEPYDYGAPELVDLELYLMWRARGMTMEAPAVRP